MRAEGFWPFCSQRFNVVYGLRTLSTAVLPVPASVAVIVTGFWPPPRLPVRVEMVKVLEVCPASTVTVDGTVAFLVSLLLSVIEIPFVGAGPLNVTVPVALFGAVTVVGLMVSETNAPATWVVAEADVDLADWLFAASNAETV
jgi:hypothetical protein